MVDVFTDQLLEANVLIEDGRIIGVGAYTAADADEVTDVGGRYVCPGFIDGHIHIESSMLAPGEFVRACLPHGTTTVIADPHEIANVSGLAGIEYMLGSTEGLPMNVRFTLPSCVPSSAFEESGALLTAEDLAGLIGHPRVIGLGEMMNYPGVIFGDAEVLAKLRVAREAGKLVNGHAPRLSGRELDRYVAAGIYDDHECSLFDEALEKLRKGQWIMIRQGTAARDLERLLGLFDEPYSRRCLLVTDDKHPDDLLRGGHIDNIIRLAAAAGKSPLTGIRMATLQAAQCFGLTELGAVAPGYAADLLILDELDTVKVRAVYYRGNLVAENGAALPFSDNRLPEELWNKVRHSFCLGALTPEDFRIEPQGNVCRVIRVFPRQLFTGEELRRLDFSRANGVDADGDVVKLAVIERHKGTGHVGLGFVAGLGLREGAIASSVAHDAHNLIVAGTNGEDMAAAANCVREAGGGLAVARGGKILASLALPVGGLMGLGTAAEMAQKNAAVREAAALLGHAEGIDAFMNLAFVSLPVIPDLKMTTMGLVNVNEQKPVSLFA